MRKTFVILLVTALMSGRDAIEVRLRRAQKGDLNIGFVDWNPRPLDESMGIVRPVSLHRTHYFRSNTFLKASQS